MPDLVILCFFAFLAGLVDAVVGGGGLIQLPMLLIVLPGIPLTTILGTNKLVSITGTSMAAFQYARKISFNWRVVLATALSAFLFSFAGARVVSLFQPEGLRPVIIALLIGIAILVYKRPDLGASQQPRFSGWRQLAVGCLAGAGIGFYDGFFGPGTGSFLIIVFIGVFGLTFLQASGSAKVVNAATNLAALLYFALHGQILYATAIPMAVFNILGALAGSRLAILKGNRFVRVFFLVVVAALILKLSYDSLLPYFPLVT